MQGECLLLFVFTLLLVVLQTVVTAHGCVEGDELCTRYITENSPCLFDCRELPEYSDTVVWHRCIGSSVETLCQQRQVVNTSTGQLYLQRGGLCFNELNRTHVGVYCYTTSSNSTCTPVQAMIKGKSVYPVDHVICWYLLQRSLKSNQL